MKCSKCQTIIQEYSGTSFYEIKKRQFAGNTTPVFLYTVRKEIICCKCYNSALEASNIRDSEEEEE
jgi:hypothetical protein